MNMLEVLKKARDQIANQLELPVGSYYTFREKGKCFCMMGAVGYIHNNGNGYMLFDDEGLDYAKMLGFDNESDVFNFNDTHTKEEVVAKFDEAIKKLENQS